MNRFNYLIVVAFFLIGFASCNVFDKRDASAGAIMYSAFIELCQCK